MNPNTPLIQYLVEQSDKLRSILDSHFNETELKDLYYDFKVDYDNLAGSNKADKVRELILYFQRHGDIEKLIGRVLDLHPTIQKRFPDLLPQKHSLAVQKMPFTNREDEIKLISSSFAPAYSLLDAPAGYGKTDLLMELERRFQEQGWSCAYILVNGKSTLSTLVKDLAHKLEVTSFSEPNEESRWGWALGGSLKRQWEDAAGQSEVKKGLVLLIDIERKPSSILKNILQNLLPPIQECLSDLSFFTNSDRQNSFRVILAGRYLAARSDILETKLPLKIRKLSPFDYDVIRDSTGKYLSNHGTHSVNQLAAHLFYLTGGHPGCMAQILEWYKKEGVTPDRFLEFKDEDIWTDIVQNFVEEIRKEINKSIEGFGTILDRLCVFRKIDYAILQHFIEEGDLDGVQDAINLADKLTGTYLFERKGRFLQDDITRRLLVIGLRHSIPKQFSEHCQQARQMCKNRLTQTNVQRREIWAIEYLFQALQQHALQIQDIKCRETIRQTFFQQDVPQALQLFIDATGSDLAMIREEQDAMLDEMTKDWEFRFLVNYYLRQNLYDEEPYNELLQQVTHFFQKRL